MILRLVVLLGLFWATCVTAEPVRMAVTTSFQNSGLADVLLPAIRTDTGLEVQLLVVGTGQALKLGQSGDVDAVLVHARAAEEEFVAGGFGTHRRDIMYNDFVLIGPGDDPAGIADSTDVTAALTALAHTRAPFVSRGDDSGTHKKERALWIEAGLDPDGFGRWYRSVGAGMGASLNTAAGLNGYILSDRASWLNFANKSDLALLFSGDARLFNQYAFLPVNGARHPHVRTDAVRRLEDWLTGPTAKTLINGFTIDGQNLFVFNAKGANE